MAYFKYKIKLEYKGRHEGDISYKKWDATKAFPHPSTHLKSSAIIQSDGYFIADLRNSNVFQDFYDTEAFTNKIIIKDQGEVVLEAENSDIFDKLSIVWMKCSCGSSPIYRLRFNFIEQVNQAPTYVKTLGYTGIV